MSGLRAFVRLDFFAVKPYFTAKTLTIFAAVAAFLSAVNGTVEMGLGVGFMLGTLFSGYPFAACEKSDLDALYATLAASRRAVVRGRYLFALLLNLCCIAFAFAFAAAGVFLARLAGASQSDGGDSLPVILAFSAALVLIQAVQLPIYFKLGYSKARPMAIVPFAVFMGGYCAFLGMAKDGGEAAALAQTLAGALNGHAAPALIAIPALAIYISYRLSLSAYGKREF